MNATGTLAPTSTVSRPLLVAGAMGGLVFVVSSVVQAIAREGFDPVRHSMSQLVLGPGGIAQIATFIVAGILMVLSAVGLQGALRDGRGSRAVPILVGVEGLGFIVAGIFPGIFPADPGNGFSPGSEAEFSAAGMIHLAAAGLAFIAVIAACFVLASRISKQGDRTWAIGGRVSAILLALGFMYANTGMTGGPLALFIGATITWIWFAFTLLSSRRLTSS